MMSKWLELTERLHRLCIELDVEMDGVTIPASAAAILNAIRDVLQKLEVSDED